MSALPHPDPLPTPKAPSPMSPHPSIAPSYPRILFLEVHGGYLDGLRIAFAPHTTCIIGGKGSGKTTLFELLRFGLAASFLAGKDSVRPLLKKNLGSGFVRLGIETAHGVLYTVERSLADERPRFFTPDGTAVKMAPGLVQIEAYGQDEIERVGEDRASQLMLNDRLAGESLRPIAVEIEEVGARLADNQTALLALEKEISALESDASEARAIEEQLRPLLEGTGADAALLQAAHLARGLRGRERQAILAGTAAVADVRSGMDALLTSLRKKLAAVVPREVRAGANGEILTAVTLELAGLAGALEQAATTLAQQVDAANAALSAHGLRLTQTHAGQDADYDALQARQKEDQDRIDQRTRLQERHAAIAGAVGALEERMRVHTQLRRARALLAEQLGALRDRRLAIRAVVEKKICTELEADGVRVKIHQDTQDGAYRALLREAFVEITNKQPKWLVERVARIRPDELVAIVRTQDTARLIEKADLGKTPERAPEVIAALTPTARLYPIEAVGVDDEAIIEAKHGRIWKDTVECSPGQRSGAILPILLLLGDWTLLVDQPDDNVDPDFMCNVILPRIAALEGKRQFVFVTHHANVPVLAKAQQIVFVTSDGASAKVGESGRVETMTPWIVTKLEGGESAFEARRQAYEKKRTKK